MPETSRLKGGQLNDTNEKPATGGDTMANYGK